ncbi:MAG: hypothetical protein U9Q99_01060 [Nanoarchaeota archaeon]|nr:hypothetical protein [Nanoarchaeota archaeon]
MRIKFKKNKQREFIQKVLEILNCPSLKELIFRGVSVNYSSLKNYFIEDYYLPLEFFNELIKLSGIDKNSLKFEIIEDNWGQIKGGEKGKFKYYLFFSFLYE